MKMIILRGLPGSGKSTLAREYCAQGYKRFNKDALRDMIDNGNYSVANEFFVHQAMLALIEGALIKGYDVVVDNTHGKQRNVAEMYDTKCSWLRELWW